MSVAKREGRRWVFDEVVEEEAHRGFTSVFFFAATNRYDALGEDADVAYDVRAMRFRELFRSLSARGAEVGLHVGYRARSDPDLIARERQLLEDAAGTPVRGSRHHYLMSDPFWSTLEGHARAGLVYDTSVCFNEAPGYRLGVALPFRPWNPELTRAVSTAQIPTVALDSALLGEGGTADSAVAHVERLLDGLKAAEGIAALDWHDSRSFPANRAFASSGEAYLRILDLLEADPEVSVQTSSELAGLALGPM